MKMESGHEAFIQRLRRSHRGVHAVAQWLHWYWMCDVHVSRRQEVPRGEDPDEYRDAGDVFVHWENHPTLGSGWWRIDVKRTEWEFDDNVARYRFPNILVAEIAPYEAARARGEPHPLAIFQTNDACTYAYAVLTETRPDWKPHRWRKNQRTEERTWYYGLPKERGHWCNLILPDYEGR